MNKKITTAPYGSWKSPITSDLIVSDFIGLGGTGFDGEDIYWTELRPTEDGRIVVVRLSPDGKISDAIPAGYNARTRVHEYGGRAYLVAEGSLYFSNFKDQRLYRHSPKGEPQPITPESELRYADYISDARRGRIICVREDHRQPGEAVNTIISLSLTAKPAENEGLILVAGNNFYASPRLSPDGTRLAWLTWNHPNMPWDGTELWVGEIQPDGSLSRARLIAGGLEESIFQPEWSPDGRLYFVSDRSGWWNLYRWEAETIEAVYPLEAEFGVPQWVFGMSTYAFESAERLICQYTVNGESTLAILNTHARTLEPVDLPFTDFWGIRAAPGRVLLTAGSPTEPPAVVLLDLASMDWKTLKKSQELNIDPGYFSLPQSIEFPTENSLSAFGYFYPPVNQDYTAPGGELPPLLVMSHGGPTGATSTTFSAEVQYFTSRGIAILDVNYGGSTGYGRAYRLRLNGQWGVVDMNDCANGALFLARKGLVDGNRLAITGGSAGGYTTLCALTFTDVFKAGASHFGISELEVFAKDTHKFESRYLDRLVGPYPEMKEVYQQRSPLNYIERLSCPMILLQGLEDKIVPPNQAELMYAAVKAKGLPVAYLPFEGEQHGFRKAENIKRALEAELYFYSRIFGFALADPVEPVQIDNLP